jgi:hypothetical protein
MVADEAEEEAEPERGRPSPCFVPWTLSLSRCKEPRRGKPCQRASGSDTSVPRVAAAAGAASRGRRPPRVMETAPLWGWEPCAEQRHGQARRKDPSATSHRCIPASFSPLSGPRLLLTPRSPNGASSLQPPFPASCAACAPWPLHLATRVTSRASIALHHLPAPYAAPVRPQGRWSRFNTTFFLGVLPWLERSWASCLCFFLIFLQHI